LNYIEKVKSYAFWLLGLKDFTEQELKDKIIKKYEKVDLEELEKIIQYLKESGYVNDEEYAKSFIRSKYNQGYGWIRIKGDLVYKKNIKEHLFSEEKNNYDWFELAKEVKTRKYKEKEFSDFKEKQKAMNYLIRRGFSYEEVEYAFEKD
tara:strand:- start:1269 stop:1715 length:447 start_codon:yes stop_codon:yes gene_type:complete